MKTAHVPLALAAFTALACAAVLVPNAPAAFPPQPVPPPEVEEKPAPQSVYAGTAIGCVLEANDNEVPRNGEEMMRALAKLGEFAQLPVAFSAVDTHSGLTRPRVVITQKPSMTPPLKSVVKPQLGLNELVLPDQVGPAPAQLPLSTTALTRPDLEGRLFLAANMEKINGALKVKTFEFISWNSRKQRFDFGFIECDPKEPQIRVVDGVRCFACHKNKGPILGQGPWSNTMHNDVVRVAAAQSLKLDFQKLRLPESIGQPRRLDVGFDRTIVAQPAMVADGVRILVPQGPAVDAAVRMGADLARDREVYRQMLRSFDGRRTFALLLTLIATPGNLKQNSDFAKAQINREFSSNFAVFAERAHAIRKAGPDVLHDFGPAGSQGTLQSVSGGGGGWGGGSTLSGELQIVWGGSPNQLTELDAKRAQGEQPLPSNRQPSNPKAFVPPDAKLPLTPAAAVNAVSLARLIGLTEADREFLAGKLREAAEQNTRKTTPAALAKEVFAHPQFAELIAAGEVPDREDFKDRFVTALNATLKARGVKELPIARTQYASGPNVAPVPGQEAREPAVVATTACLRCHDVRAAGAKPAFSPIPVLAFDPFDKSGREAWVKVTPAKDRAAVLARLAKRVFDDRDMPPEDSAEYAQVRAKDPELFATTKTWLEAELQKVK